MKNFIILLSVILISACASTTNVRGQSAVNTQLKKDTYKMFSVIAAAQLDCQKIEFAEITKSTVSGAIATETWIANGCGKTAPFNIIFQPSPMGGYTYNITAIK